jgi:hypothetical protein
MKLLRYGETGYEKPGLMDNNGDIRDLSSVVADITGAILEAGTLCWQSRKVDVYWPELR